MQPEEWGEAEPGEWRLQFPIVRLSVEARRGLVGRFPSIPGELNR
jgi:hypothetical protein